MGSSPDFEAAKRYIEERLENETPEDLFFHNINHTRDFYRGACILADAENVPEHGKQTSVNCPAE